MHARGKDWKITLTYPDGRNEVMLDVPNYDFNWQTVYYPDTPFTIPAGTRVDVVGHWDNSANNKNNPDPTVPAIMGQQNGQEMWGSFFFAIASGDADHQNLTTKVTHED
jgi:hypothetical protein